MAIAYRSSTTFNSAGASGATLIFNKPAGLALNDYMVCIFVSNGASISTIPTGFSLIDTDSSMYTYGKLATSNDVAASTFTFTLGSSVINRVGILSAVSGVDTAKPLGSHIISQDNSSGTGLTYTGITPEQTDSFYFIFAGSQSNRNLGPGGYAITNDNPTWNESLNAVLDFASDTSIAVAYSTNRTQSTATGNVIMTASGNLNNSVGGLIEIRFADIADKYWVGGTGTWNTSLTNWSLTSGGSGGANSPTLLTPNVFFDANSGGGTATTGASLAVGGNLAFTGYTGTFAGSNTLNIGGSLTIASGMTLSFTGAITFSATSTGKTITLSGKTSGSTLTFNGIGGGWTLQDALVVSGASITLTAGSLNLGNQNVTCPTFICSNTAGCNLTLGSGTMTLNGTGTVWSFGSASTCVITPNTSTIKLTDTSASTKTFAGGSLNYYNLWITGAGSGAYTIVGSNNFNDFKVDTPPHTVNFTVGTTQSVESFTVSGTVGNLMTLQSTSAGNPFYLFNLSNNQISCDYLSLKDSHALS